jgi:hypothetical protein
VEDEEFSTWWELRKEALRTTGPLCSAPLFECGATMLRLLFIMPLVSQPRIKRCHIARSD